MHSLFREFKKRYWYSGNMIECNNMRILLKVTFWFIKNNFFNTSNSHPICIFEWFYILYHFTGYSLIYNPWHTLFFEALESVTLSLSFTAAVTYAAKLSTTTTDSSIQGLLGGVYYGVGEQFFSLFLLFSKEKNIAICF